MDSEEATAYTFTVDAYDAAGNRSTDNVGVASYGVRSDSHLAAFVPLVRLAVTADHTSQ